MSSDVDAGADASAVAEGNGEWIYGTVLMEVTSVSFLCLVRRPREPPVWIKLLGIWETPLIVQDAPISVYGIENDSDADSQM